MQLAFLGAFLQFRSVAPGSTWVWPSSARRSMGERQPAFFRPVAKRRPGPAKPTHPFPFPSDLNRNPRSPVSGGGGVAPHQPRVHAHQPGPSPPCATNLTKGSLPMRQLAGHGCGQGVSGWAAPRMISERLVLFHNPPPK